MSLAKRAMTASTFSQSPAKMITAVTRVTRETMYLVVYLPAGGEGEQALADVGHGEYNPMGVGLVERSL